MKILFSVHSLVEAVIAGLLAVIPAYHPILLEFACQQCAIFTYFLYYAIAGPVSFIIGAYSSAVLYSRVAAHKLLARGDGLRAVYLYGIGFLAGILLAFLYYPVAGLFSIELPDWIVFAVVLSAAISIIFANPRRSLAVLVFAVSGAFGVYLLATANPVSHPLQVGVSGIFGLGALLASIGAYKPISVRPLNSMSIPVVGIVFGILSAMLVAYFPAISPAVAAAFLHRVAHLDGEDVVVATGATASSTLVFSVFARKYGVVRTALAAQVSNIHVLSFAAIALVSSLFGVLFAFLLFRSLARAYDHRVVRLGAAFLVVALVLVFFGLPAMFALLAGACLSLFARLLEVNQSVLMGFLMVPTLLIYAPM